MITFTLLLHLSSKINVHMFNIVGETSHMEITAVFPNGREVCLILDPRVKEEVKQKLYDNGAVKISIKKL